MTTTSDVKPYQAALIIAFFVCIFVSVFFLMDKRNEFKGASFLHYQDGFINILLDDTIHRYSDYGDYSQIYLPDLGIESLVGGFSFFPNGDLLIRKDASGFDLWNKILVYLRVSGKGTAKNESATLVRCDVVAKACVEVTNDVSFERSFRSHVLDNGHIIVADTSNHRLLRFDEDGALVEKAEKGFRFPNKVQVINDRLYVANTNRNAISILDLEGKIDISASDRWQHWSLKSGVAKENKHTFPTEFVKIEKGLVVLSQGISLARGSLYLMDSKGSLQGVFDMPRDTDIISIAPYRGEILASDFSSYKVYRFSQRGELLGELNSPELVAALEANKHGYHQYDQYLTYLYIVGGIVFVFLFIIAAWLEWARQKHQKQSLQQVDITQFGDYPEPGFDHPEVKWLAHHRNKLQDNKYIQWALHTLVGVSLLIVLVSVLKMDNSVVKLKLGLIIIGTVFFYGFIFWFAKQKNQPELGVLGEWVLLLDLAGNRDVKRASEVKFLGEFLLVGDAYILLQSGHHPIFDKSDKDKYLAPRIALAEKLSWLELWKFLWRKRDKNFLLSLALIPVFILSLFLR